MNTSNFSDVGQMRRSRGTSTKIRTKPDILQSLSAEALVVDLSRVDNEQADDTEDNDDGMVEDIGDTEGNAEEDA